MKLNDPKITKRRSTCYHKVAKENRNKIMLQLEHIIKDLTSKSNTQNQKQHTLNMFNEIFIVNAIKIKKLKFGLIHPIAPIITRK